VYVARYCRNRGRRPRWTSRLTYANATRIGARPDICPENRSGRVFEKIRALDTGRISTRVFEINVEPSGNDDDHSDYNRNGSTVSSAVGIVKPISLRRGRFGEPISSCARIDSRGQQ